MRAGKKCMSYQELCRFTKESRRPLIRPRMVHRNCAMILLWLLVLDCDGFGCKLEAYVGASAILLFSILSTERLSIYGGTLDPVILVQ